jgi:NAD(P)-dependent dehydrogenase (short-subunit alcohol dehydrogenase family)
LAPPESLEFLVASVAARFRSVRIAVKSRSLQGFLETLSRLPPVKQPSVDVVKSRVSKDEFRDSTALIVGGSRGLGELTAKLIAAGGGQVAITYANGKSDAAAVAAEIQEAALSCTTMPYDVRKSATEQLAALTAAPSHIYYFSTPRISRRKSDLFDPIRLNDFNTYYVTAFFDLVKACARLRPEGVKVFFPSSTFIEERPAGMTEYVMSKAAAEMLCEDLSKYTAGVHVITRRLPRLPTDQTSSVVQARSANPIDVLLPIVREMHRPLRTPQ